MRAHVRQGGLHGSQHRGLHGLGDRQARDELVTALVNDALALLAGLDAEAITAAGGKPAEARLAGVAGSLCGVMRPSGV